MARRRSYNPEQIITKLREAEILLRQAKTIKEASKQLEIHKQTCYRWLRENGCIESFTGRLRDELLNGEIFFTLK